MIRIKVWEIGGGLTGVAVVRNGATIAASASYTRSWSVRDAVRKARVIIRSGRVSP